MCPHDGIRKILEIGTWYGGGSTQNLVKGLMAQFGDVGYISKSGMDPISMVPLGDATRVSGEMLRV